jgi:type I restriction enzyme M protein
VLFINADAELRAGRAQNYLDPEHIEKIVSAYRGYEDIPGFAAVVSHAELAENDYNFNIRRYADNAPPPEPHDVKAHLQGGVPRDEVMAAKELLLDHGVDPTSLFVDWDKDYLEFVPEIAAKADLKARIESHPGLVKKEATVDEAFTDWWEEIREDLSELPKTGKLMKLRADLLDTFQRELLPLMLLDRFKVAGVVASWWGEAQFDLRTLAARGFVGTVDGWVTTVATAMEEDGGKVDPLDHALVRRLLPDLVEEIAEVEGKVAELDGTIKAAQSTSDEDEDDAESDEEALSEEEIKELKKELRQAKKTLKALRQGFVERLRAAQSELTDDAAQDLVLGILRDDLKAQLDRAITAHRQAVVSAVENWWDKYQVTLRDIEGERDAAKAKLEGFLKELGYAG